MTFKDFLLEVKFDCKAIGRVCHIPKFYGPYKRIEELKNCEKGKRCFIVATGPSLRVEDVEKLKNEITIGVNGVFNLFDQTEWRPSYYLCGDSQWFLKNRVFFMKKEKPCSKEMMVNDIIRNTAKDNNIPLPDDTIVLPLSFYNIKTHYNKKLFRFSKNLLWGTYTANTITNYAINIAIYMGIREIYLIGADCNYSDPIKHYGLENEDISEERAKEIERKMNLGYELVKDRAIKMNTKIYNATRGGKLEVFSRVDFDSLF